MALLITLSLTLSISQLKKHLRALAEGDLTQLAHIPNRDELGELGQTYNATLRALGQLARQLESQSRQVSTAVVALTSYARKNVSGSSQQSASINQITSTTHQLAATAQAIFNQAANVTEAVTSSYQEALNVQSVVEKMNEAHQRGQDTLLLTTSRLGSLSQEVYTIEAARASLTTAFSETSQVVEGVDEVAQQTHLLALNAAIEAASAGEYGERFSQIAQEVRALSQKATLGARKTASLLEVMGDAITQLAHACDRALELAKLAGSDTEQSQQVLAELLALSLQVREAALVIVGRVEGANTLAKEIGVATGQQKSATEQVLASLRDMAQLTQQTFQTAKESQEVTSGLDQSATQLLVSARLFKLAAY
jgi:methyl-accepting chemotaxis protein